MSTRCGVQKVIDKSIKAIIRSKNNTPKSSEEIVKIKKACFGEIYYFFLKYISK
jgi:hypothetical protein